MERAVYVYEVEDGNAGAWSAQIAVMAAKPAEASRRLRAAGLRKSQIHNEGRPIRVITESELEEVSRSPLGMARRRNNDGWTAWVALPVGATLNWRDDPPALRRAHRRGEAGL